VEFESKEQFQKMVQEEVQRSAIRDALDKKSARTIYETLKHPLVSVLIGFLLTGVAGTLLANYFQAQEKKRLLQREAYSHVRQFSQALSLRTTEGGYLRSAMSRKTNKETLLGRKKSYDEAVKEWNTNYTSHLLTFREYSGSRDPIFIERNIENDLVPILRAIDVCLTEEFDIIRDKEIETEPVEIACWILADNKYYSVGVRTLIESARTCGYEIENLLFSWITVNLKFSDDAWTEAAPRVQKVISNRCAVSVTADGCSANKPPHRTVVPLRVIAASEG